MKDKFGYTKKQKEMIERDIEREETLEVNFIQRASGLVTITKKGELK